MNKIWCVWVYDCRTAEQTKPACFTNEEAAWKDVGAAIVDNVREFRQNRSQMVALLEKQKYPEAMQLFNETSGDVEIHCSELTLWE